MHRRSLPASSPNNVPHQARPNGFSRPRKSLQLKSTTHSQPYINNHGVNGSSNEKTVELKETITRLLEAIQSLFISEQQRRNFENKINFIMEIGVRITSSPNYGNSVITSDSFFSKYNEFCREFKEFSKTSSIDRIQNFFKSEISQLKTVVRSFDGPTRRISYNKFINSLESELLIYKSVSCKAAPIETAIDQLNEELVASFKQDSQTLLDAQKHLNFIQSSIVDFSQKEPKMKQTILMLETTGNELKKVFDIPIVQPKKNAALRRSNTTSAIRNTRTIKPSANIVSSTNSSKEPQQNHIDQLRLRKDRIALNRHLTLAERSLIKKSNLTKSTTSIADKEGENWNDKKVSAPRRKSLGSQAQQNKKPSTGNNKKSNPKPPNKPPKEEADEEIEIVEEIVEIIEEDEEEEGEEINLNKIEEEKPPVPIPNRRKPPPFFENSDSGSQNSSSKAKIKPQGSAPKINMKKRMNSDLESKLKKAEQMKSSPPQKKSPIKPFIKEHPSLNKKSMVTSNSKNKDINNSPSARINKNNNDRIEFEEEEEIIKPHNAIADLLSSSDSSSSQYTKENKNEPPKFAKAFNFESDEDESKNEDIKDDNSPNKKKTLPTKILDSLKTNEEEEQFIKKTPNQMKNNNTNEYRNSEKIEVKQDEKQDKFISSSSDSEEGAETEINKHQQNENKKKNISPPPPFEFQPHNSPSADSSLSSSSSSVTPKSPISPQENEIKTKKSSPTKQSPAPAFYLSDDDEKEVLNLPNQEPKKKQAASLPKNNSDKSDGKITTSSISKKKAAKTKVNNARSKISPISSPKAINASNKRLNSFNKISEKNTKTKPISKSVGKTTNANTTTTSSAKKATPTPFHRQPNLPKKPFSAIPIRSKSLPANANLPVNKSNYNSKVNNSKQQNQTPRPKPLATYKAQNLPKTSPAKAENKPKPNQQQISDSRQKQNSNIRQQQQNTNLRTNKLAISKQNKQANNNNNNIKKQKIKSKLTSQLTKENEGLKKQINQINKDIIEIDAELSATPDTAITELQYEVDRLKDKNQQLIDQISIESATAVSTETIRAYEDFNNSLKAGNKSTKIIVEEMNNLINSGVESQTAAFSNVQLMNENKLLEKEIQKARNELEYLEKQRKSIISSSSPNQRKNGSKNISTTTIDHILNAYAFLMFENAGLSEEIKITNSFISDEKRQFEYIMKILTTNQADDIKEFEEEETLFSNEPDIDSIIKKQIEEMNRELETVENSIHGISHIPIPSPVKTIDRSLFDLNQRKFERLKSIQIIYHNDKPKSDDQIAELEEEYSKLESEIGETNLDVYEKFANLSNELDELRLNYSENMEAGKVAQEALIETTSQANDVSLELNILVTELEHQNIDPNINQELKTKLFNLFVERIEIATKLKMIDEMLTERYERVFDGQNLNIMQKIQILQDNELNDQQENSF